MMNSQEVEARIAKIQSDISELHEELVEDEEAAWLELPAVQVITLPNTNDMVVSLKIGYAEEA
jgi:hypothetical protein